MRNKSDHIKNNHQKKIAHSR